MSHRSRKTRLLLLAALLAAAGSACRTDGGPADSDEPGPAPGTGGSGTATYSIGGNVSGLTGSGLGVVNGGDSLTLDGDGAFVFAAELADGADYAVVVTAQPQNPDNVCTVENGSGTVDGADVTDVAITCTGRFAFAGSLPADGDSRVARAIAPVLTFSAAVDPGTATPDTVVLRGESGDVEYTVEVAGDTVTLSPAQPLLPLAAYTLMVTTELGGSGGERLEDAVTLQFETRDGAWQADVAIDAAGGSANDAQVAYDGHGNALAAWLQESGTGTDIWANYFAAGSGWGTAERVEQNNADNYAGAPRIVFLADGSALAVWTQTDGASGGNAWSNRFDPAAGWGTPELIETGSGDVLGFVEVAAADGHGVVAVWAQISGATIDAWANRYDPAGGWGTPVVLDAVDEHADAPRVAMDHGGNVMVAWEQAGNLRTDIWASGYRGGAWDSPVLVSSTNDERAGDPRPAFDRDGNLLLVFSQEDGFDSHMHAARYTPGGGWASPERIGPALPGTVSYSDLAIAPDGSAIAVWEQPVNTGGSVTIEAWASRYDPGSGWSAGAAISRGDVFHPKIAFDPSGHALAAWYSLDFTRPSADAYSVWANRYTAGSGWGSPERIGSFGNLIGTFMPNLAVAPNGDAMAVWTRSHEVRVNQFE